MCPSPRAVVLSIWLIAASGAAQEPGPEDKKVVAAANAFTQAQEAELGGDHARAAELFEVADRIAPTPEALRSATRARLSAGELASAAGHAEELLRRYPDDPPSRELAAQVLTRARPELTRYRLQCEAPCTVVIDGLASGLVPLTSQILYATPGSHEFEVAFEGGRERSMRLSGDRGEALSVKVQPPPPGASESAPPPPSAPQPVGVAGNADAARARGARAWLPPAYLWGALSATAVASGLTVWSGVDLLRARDDFESGRDATRAAFERGERKDLRTGLLIGTTSALAVGTAVIAWLTDFEHERRARGAGRTSARLTAGPVPRGAVLGMQQRF